MTKEKDTRWIQWEGRELQPGCRWPTGLDVLAELGWTKEDELAYLEFVRKVAAEHGFPIPTWTPRRKEST